jgi:hypothetical protein
LFDYIIFAIDLAATQSNTGPKKKEHKSTRQDHKTLNDNSSRKQMRMPVDMPPSENRGRAQLSSTSENVPFS